MSSRPRWAEATRLFVSDRMIDSLADDGSDDEASDVIERLVLDKLCEMFGHEIEDDQCMKPEHRYCVYCRRPETTIQKIESKKAARDD